jgi:sigma-B regulation protein RsbU (phosphoserine phosphatase)
MPEGLFFTVLYARLNRQTGRLILVNGGHPPAVCLKKGKYPIVVRQSGDVIGAFSDAVFGTTEVMLRKEDRFFLYTDGLVEEGGSQEKGIERLTCVCNGRRDLSLDAMVETVTADMPAWSAAQDDIVLMGVEM